jgi:hypothetical protein
MPLPIATIGLNPAALALMIEGASQRLAYIFPGNLSLWQRAPSVFNRHT